jgi:hypothetical protein
MLEIGQGAINIKRLSPTRCDLPPIWDELRSTSRARSPTVNRAAIESTPMEMAQVRNLTSL